MTLDEVIIGIKEQMGLGDPILIDALHYLEEYKNKQNVGTMMFALHNTNKTVCDDCWLSREMAGEGFKQIYKKYIEEENPPLTWDELKGMTGKPVWFEDKSSPYITVTSWMLIHYFYVTSTGVEGIFAHDFTGGTAKIINKDYGEGKTWQAYRKERE